MQNIRVCGFCGYGRVCFRLERIEVREHSDRGWLVVDAALQVGRCNRCGLAALDESMDAEIETLLRKAYLKLPPR